MIEDDEYLISVAKTEFREAYNTGDVDRLASVFALKFTDWSEGEPAFYQEEAVTALRAREERLFQRYQVKLIINMAKVTVMGGFATDRGWYKFQRKDKQTGHESQITYRYLCTWAKTEGGWKISFTMTNREVPPHMLAADGE